MYEIKYSRTLIIQASNIQNLDYSDKLQKNVSMRLGESNTEKATFKS